MTGLFCTCKSLNVELDVGINRIDLVSLWVMRHPCNQACFLAMNVISSNAVQLQSDGQSLLNQDHFIFFSVLSFNAYSAFVLLLFYRECMHACVHRHTKNTATLLSLPLPLPPCPLPYCPFNIEGIAHSRVVKYISLQQGLPKR